MDVTGEQYLYIMRRRVIIVIFSLVLIVPMLIYRYLCKTGSIGNLIVEPGNTKLYFDNYGIEIDGWDRLS